MERKKVKQAVALRYDMEKDEVPIITAAGQGAVAENIVDLGERNEVPIYYDERLVKELIQLKVGAEIPPELYEIVAQVLVFVEAVDMKKGEKEK